MAEPKKRTNKSKGGMRRMHITKRAPSLSFCNNCQKQVLNHNICPYCGYYKGKKVLNKDN